MSRIRKFLSNLEKLCRKGRENVLIFAFRKIKTLPVVYIHSYLLVVELNISVSIDVHNLQVHIFYINVTLKILHFLVV